MLNLQLIYFAPFLLCQLILVRYSVRYSPRGLVTRFFGIAAALWIVVSIALFIALKWTPDPVLAHLPTVLVACFPFFGAAAVVYSLGENWSVKALTASAFGCSLIAAILSPVFFLVGTCITNKNCL